MAITALKSGARLPIKPSETGKPPQENKKQIVLGIPIKTKLRLSPHIVIPYASKGSVSSAETESEPEPEVFDVTSMIQS